jgi:uncharacterized protein YjbI with pentapeptide repeats
MRSDGWQRVRGRITIIWIAAKKRRHSLAIPLTSSSQPDRHAESRAAPSHLREVTPESLNAILQAHQSWLASNGQEGERADLSQTGLADINLPGANLRGVNLHNADLQNANLAGANLSEANLSSANLQRAVLRGTDLWRALLGKANLKKSDLSGANLEEASLGGANLQRACLAHASLKEASLHQARLWDADLRDAELAEAHDLSTARLAGANLAGAKLPAAIERFDGLGQVRESAEIARPMFLMILLGCLYAFATISSTTDAALLANFPATFLPDVSVPIPTVWFYFAMPFLLFCLYVYLLLYVEQLWRELSNLPSVFPDGAPLHRRVYPWLLMRLLSRAANRRPLVFGPGISAARGTINVVFILLVWWLVPVTLLFFGARYLPAHDWYGTSAHIVLLVLAIGSGGFGMHSFGPAQAMRRGDDHQAFSAQTLLRSVVTYRSAIAIGMGVVFAGFSYGSINGVPPERARIADARTWVPYALSIIGYSPFADFHKTDVSSRPGNWKAGIDDTELVTGADLGGRNLRYAEASRAFLVMADLHNADLYGAILVGAHLEGANLAGANLDTADLTGANFKAADLTAASLQEAILIDADLRGAILRLANLKAADLRGANLRDQAVLGGANLRDALLSHAKLQEAELNGANLQNI